MNMVKWFAWAAALALQSMPVFALVFVVTTTADTDDVTPGDTVCQDSAGFCSLRAAVREANALVGPDEIQIQPAAYRIVRLGSGEDAAVTGDLDVTDDLVIVGAGRTVSIIDARPMRIAGDADRVFDMPFAVSLHLIDVTITGGGELALFSGGGVNNDNGGILVLTRVNVVRNASANGAGVYSDGGTTEVVNSTFRLNEATGIVVSNGLLSVAESFFVFNSCGGSCGAAIRLLEGATARITRSRFVGNTSDGGGAIRIASASTLTDRNSIYVANESTGSGGAVYVTAGDATFIGVTMDSNRAAGGGPSQRPTMLISSPRT